MDKTNTFPLNDATKLNFDIVLEHALYIMVCRSKYALSFYKFCTKERISDLNQVDRVPFQIFEL